MRTKIPAWAARSLPIAIALAATSGHIQAVSWQFGELDAQIDSQMSLGASWSMSNPDRRFIHTDTMVDGRPMNGQATAGTSDDGRLNFKRNDVFSQIFKGTHDLELRYGNSGGFFRGMYWYDFETKDGSQHFYDIDDSGRHPLQKGSGVTLLDAFVYHNYALGNLPGNIRLGRQVVSWGEGLFVGNSVNAINPLDVAAFRRPGSEVKEALIPVEMLYLSQSLNDSLTVEAFYQLKWAPTITDNCGTFFGSDPIARGCHDRLIVAGMDRPQGEVLPIPGNVYIARARKDDEARDEGQFGVALRWFAPELNDTEFGLYAMNYHMRTPSFSGVAGNFLATSDPAELVPGLDGTVGAGGYFLEYPEDVRLYGVSFQTNIAGMPVSGEFSYRPNLPMQIAGSDVSRTILQLGVDNTHRGLVGLPTGSYIRGYERKEFFQAQLSAVKTIDRILGASRLALAGEVAYNHIGGLGSSNGETKFGRDSLFGQSPFADGTCSSLGSSPKAASWCENDGYMTSNSWGYRLRAGLEYSNVIAGINLSPNLAFAHDVEGYSPNFTENAKSVSVGLNADYANKYNASLSYTNFFDGKYNTLVDRDFASLSFSVSF
ncbi:DUF1302 domain-containing protein [Pseudomonas sp. gcc21]|uniref:DUF1302 domain-containing protein n=1 Tax=Pseudomonas sp. gcc21 TaxID=2726989 RepID=UPI001451B200|nr:DUF1302 domain-containing protein [Pseudomonas sp. gcc21]QJD59196.1 DUF1302 domain-containing protein [Pseudomonas sp. gcc21]